MLLLASPGGSPYSVVPVAEEAPAPCSNQHNPRCRKRYSPAWRSWVRVENAFEGVLRYDRIARIAHKVTRGRQHILPHLLVTIERESGFRRDVHAGIGPASRGGCRYRRTKRVRVAIPGTCKDGCLVQIRRQRRGWKTPRGYAWATLMGLDDAATERCLVTGADFLEALHKRCGGRPVCIFGVYMGAPKPSANKEATLRARRLRLVRSHLKLFASARAERAR